MSSPETTAMQSSAALPADVEARLTAVAGDLINKAVLILPTQTRDRVTHYLSDDLGAMKLAFAVGLDSAFLVPSDERTYLEEYSAEWALDLALAVMQTMTLEIATGIGAYLWERAKMAIDRGQHAGPPSKVPLRVSVARYERDTEGRIAIDNLKIEGDTETVAEVVRNLVQHSNQKNLTASSNETSGDGPLQLEGT